MVLFLAKERSWKHKFRIRRFPPLSVVFLRWNTWFWTNSGSFPHPGRLWSRFMATYTGTHHPAENHETPTQFLVTAHVTSGAPVFSPQMCNMSGPVVLYATGKGGLKPTPHPSCSHIVDPPPALLWSIEIYSWGSFTQKCGLPGWHSKFLRTVKYRFGCATVEVHLVHAPHEIVLLAALTTRRGSHCHNGVFWLFSLLYSWVNCRS